MVDIDGTSICAGDVSRQLIGPVHSDIRVGENAGNIGDHIVAACGVDQRRQLSHIDTVESGTESCPERHKQAAYIARHGALPGSV